MGQEEEIKEQVTDFLSDYNPKSEEDPELEPEIKEEDPELKEPPPGTELEPEPEVEEEEEEEPELEPEEEIEEGKEELEIDYKAQNEALLARIAQLEKTDEEEEIEVPDIIPETGTKIEKIDFLEGVDEEKYEAILEDPKELNLLLNKVYSLGLENSSRLASERTLKNIPKLVMDYNKRHQALTKLVGEFYESNEDLVNVKKTVAAITNEVAAEMPDKPITEVLEEAAIRTRKTLGLPTKIMKREKVKPAGKTALPPKGKSGKGAKPTQLKGLAKEIDDLLTE